MNKLLLFLALCILPLQAVCTTLGEYVEKYQRETYELFANQFGSFDATSTYLIYTFGRTKKAIMFVFKEAANYTLCICTDNNGGEIYKEITITKSPLLDWAFTEMSAEFASTQYEETAVYVDWTHMSGIGIYSQDSATRVIIPTCINYIGDDKASKKFAKKIEELREYLYGYWREIYDWPSMFR